MIASPAATRPTARRWVASADDFAIDPGAVEAIVDLIERGRLTATSALVDSPHWPGSARALAPLRAEATGIAPGADVGLHLNLTQDLGGNSGAVWPLAELIARCRLGLIARARLREAIERQLDAFEDAMGCGPDYVDGHQHVHQFAGVREELAAALLRRYRSARPWLRSTRAPPAIRDSKARFIAGLGDRGLRKQAAQCGLRVSAFLVGVYGFSGDGAAYRRRLVQWMQAGPDATVLMCHPALRPQPGDPIAAARTIEYAELSGAHFPMALHEAGIGLERGSRLFSIDTR